MTPLLFQSPLARKFHNSKQPFINTAASARWEDALLLEKLFQQFVNGHEKPLKRLVPRSAPPHRAKAPVLMRIFCDDRELSGLEGGMKSSDALL